MYVGEINTSIKEKSKASSPRSFLLASYLSVNERIDDALSMLNRVSAQAVSPRTKTRLRSDTVSSNCANENITCSMADQRRLQVRLPVNKRSLNENNP